MDPLAGNVTQRGIDHALALQTRCTGEAGAFYFHGEMRFAAAIVAGMAMVVRAVVDYGKAGGGKGAGQQGLDFLGKWSGHGFTSSATIAMWHPVMHDRFHGRIRGSARGCERPGCPEAGEFRAPGPRGSGFDGPGDYRWFCLDHVREFNAGYDWFAGMSADEILRAQSPIHGWEAETRAFRPTAGIDSAPRWADFSDPLEAISKRARMRKPAQRADGRPVSPEERRALEVLGLKLDADRHDLRTAYTRLVRQYHPDRNGGDRSYEARLSAVVDAYQLLRRAPAFA